MSVQERLCGSNLTHIEHSILYQFHEFRNCPDVYLSKLTNPRLIHTASAVFIITLSMLSMLFVCSVNPYLYYTSRLSLSCLDVCMSHITLMNELHISTNLTCFTDLSMSYVTFLVIASACVSFMYCFVYSCCVYPYHVSKL